MYVLETGTRVLFTSIMCKVSRWNSIKLSKRKEKNKAGIDGGLPAKPASQVLSLAWQCDIVLHVAYGVALVLLVI